MPPVFPAWMRHADPLLVREDSNGLFQAFRVRRARPRQGVGSLLVGMMGPAMQVVIWAIVFGVGGRLSNYSYIILCMLFAGDFLTRRSEGLPISLGQVFDQKREGKTLGPMGADVWLAPATGGEVIEALYLEYREGSLKSLPTSAVVLGILLAGIYLRYVWPPLGQLWKEALPLTLWGLLLWRGVRILLLQGSGDAITGCGRVVDLWKTRGTSDEAYRSEQRWRVFRLLFGVVLVAVPLSLLGICLWPGLAASSLAAALASLMPGNRPLMVAALLTVMFLAVELYARSRPRGIEEHDLEALKRAREPYEAYMRRIVLGDHD